MRTEDLRLRRQCDYFLDGAPHLVGGALEEPAATHREHGVPDKNFFFDWEVVHDVARGVPRGVEHPGDYVSDGHLVALANGAVHPRDLALPLPARTDHLAAVPRLELRVAAGVIPVVVSVEDVGELPALLLQRSLDGCHLGGVDHRGRAGGGIVQKERVVVLQARELVNLHLAGRGRRQGRRGGGCERGRRGGAGGRAEGSSQRGGDQTGEAGSAGLSALGE
mmetsp:Transcript_14713/g.62150  ORF Transcript_14713/g.62150 Transcript_14713/m.62150 type:complete len:222 (+) Transcript_14713:252-917(+)